MRATSKVRRELGGMAITNTQRETWGKRRRRGGTDEIKNGHEYNVRQAKMRMA
jgi:hypothetical protein